MTNTTTATPLKKIGRPRNGRRAKVEVRMHVEEKAHAKAVAKAKGKAVATMIREWLRSLSP